MSTLNIVISRIKTLKKVGGKSIKNAHILAQSDDIKFEGNHFEIYLPEGFT